MNPPSLVSILRAVGWVTFRELIRERVVYSVLVLSFLLFGLSYLAAQLSFIRPERIIVDFGLTAIQVSTSLIGIMAGATLLRREMDRRTIYVALSHPVSRLQFLLGKFAGLAFVLFLNILVLVGVYFTLILVASGANLISGVLGMALFLDLVQSCVLASIALCLSVYLTSTISIMISVGIFLVGTNVSQIRFLAAQSKSTLEPLVLKAIASVWPNMEHFNLGTKVSYGLPIPAEVFGLSVLYGFFVIALMLLLSGYLLTKREI